jgi:hypothetical protein
MKVEVSRAELVKRALVSGFHWCALFVVAIILVPLDIPLLNSAKNSVFQVVFNGSPNLKLLLPSVSVLLLLSCFSVDGNFVKVYIRMAIALYVSCIAFYPTLSSGSYDSTSIALQLLVGYFFLISSKDWQRSIFLVVVLVLFTCICGSYMYFTGQNVMNTGVLRRAGGLFNDPNTFGMLLSLSILLGETIADRFRRIPYLQGILMFCSVLTWHRVTFIVLTALYFIRSRFKNAPGYMRFALISLVLLVITVSVRYSPGVLNSTMRSSSGRWAVQSQCISKFGMSLPFGVGSGNVAIDLGKDSAGVTRAKVGDCKNFYLNIALELGLFGVSFIVLLFAALVFSICYGGFSPSVMVMCGLLLFGLFNTYYFLNNAVLNILFGICCGLMDRSSFKVHPADLQSEGSGS